MILQRIPATTEIKVTPYEGTPLISVCVPLQHHFNNCFNTKIYSFCIYILKDYI